MARSVNLTILGEINDRIANMVVGSKKPDRLPERGDVVVGRATEYLKLLFLVCRQLDEELEPLSVELRAIETEALSIVGGRDVVTMQKFLEVAIDPRLPKLRERCVKLEVELVPKQATAKFARRLFFAECKRAYPELEDKQIEVDAHWQLVYRDPKAAGVNPFEDLLSALSRTGRRRGSPL